MKYVVLLGDGMADYPVDALGGKTPLEAARTPNMDRLARCGEMGMARTVPDGMPPGSDVANLSVLGYDPKIYYTGRSPLEALSIGVDLGPDDVAFRCNLVTLSDEPEYEQKTMIDYSSDEIETAESRQLVAEIAKRLSRGDITFYPGISYRHLMVWHKGPTNGQMTPPHDIPGRMVGDYLPTGAGADILRTLMIESNTFLPDHAVNQARVERGVRPANSIWLWGQGKKPALVSFKAKYGLTGSVISAVDLTKGLGIGAGLDSIDVPGATGNVHTNYPGKAEAAIRELKNGKDFVYIHIEAPDESGHRGELENKILSIEDIDRQVLGTLLEKLPALGDFRILLMPDHPTPLSVRTHVSDPVPFVLYQSGTPEIRELGYTEANARSTGLVFEEAHRLMDRLLAR